MISFPLFVVDQEATLEVGAEGGTAEAAQEAGAVPPAVTKVIGELGTRPPVWSPSCHC